MEVRLLRTPGLGDNSYVLAEDGLGIVIDPQRDIDRFMTEAEALEVEVRYVLETHLHNDYLSGGRELARLTGADLVLPAGAGAAFAYVPAFHLEEFGEGRLRIRPLHTPGHTPEHTSYLVSIDGVPIAVFSGGSLLVGAAGRSDLLGPDRATQLARLQYGSVRRLADLPDRVSLYPTHGAGSFCSAGLAGPATSTIGDEKRTSPVLRHLDADQFVAAQLASLDPYPRYYAHMGPANLFGPTPMPSGTAPSLSADDVESLVGRVEIVDARPKQAYADGHLPKAWGIELNEDFVTWVGWLLPYDAPLVLVVDNDQDVGQAVTALARIGFDHVKGVFSGMDEWLASGRPVVSHTTITARGFLEGADPDPQVLDVRSAREWSDGHLEGSVHCYLPDLLDATPIELDPGRPVYVGCTTGHRASTAAGLLAGRGYRPVVMVGASLLGVLMLRQQRATV
ncbi:MAG TPA: rhodanese-like domain-containing protein [Acidimicrobiia bacterium]|nr:rhodanese-like domain-containing protein [Acidimicrobiia bacterium]